MTPEIIWVDTTPSTNTLLASMPEAVNGTAVAARCQSAGRGQRGNSWESEPGKNITMSMLLRPENLEARCQFAVSMAVSVAVASVISRHIAPVAAAEVKWPNDIYVADRKICGILIENTLSGPYLSKAVAGMGINVNQTLFVSDAPNPVSMAQIAGHEFDVQAVAEEITAEVMRLMPLTATAGGRAELEGVYRSMLWRREGFHPYRDTATAERFMGAIENIGPMGHLTLRTPDNCRRTYAFKEVEALLT